MDHFIFRPNRSLFLPSLRLVVLACALLLPATLAGAAATPEMPAASPGLVLNDQEYLEMPGLNVMLAHDYYPEGHQGGVGIIQNGRRVATNGDLRLDRTPGQWQPVPKVGARQVDRAKQQVSLRLEYPDPAKNRRGFNPVNYPDLAFAYTVRVRPEGAAFRIIVDLEQPLPEAFVGQVGFNLELFPGLLFGRSWNMDGTFGTFPRQANGPGTLNPQREYEIAALATGRKLVIAPEVDEQRLTIEIVRGSPLELVDGRGQHDNGWFVVRSLIAAGATTDAVNWLVTPHALPGFLSEPVVQVSQVGYHPEQDKIAVVELDPRDTTRHPLVLARVRPDGGFETALETPGREWGRFLRYNYLQLDFTNFKRPGMYVVRYGTKQSPPFQISASVYQRHVWQPTLEYFLPAQMCHMRINDRYRVWHDVCHLDDARMAPVDHNHFDGYLQGHATLTSFAPGAPVPGLNAGGWHDAGDDDLRVESQSGTMAGLALAWEEFRPAYDNTTIDQAARVVEVHRPDGKPDLLQQIEHGALSVVGGYRALGRLYRGIISPTLRQYVLLGDPAAQTDNVVFDPSAREPAGGWPAVGTGRTGSPDDRWVFTENNPRRELAVAADLAATARALRGFNDPLAEECQQIAQALWTNTNAIQPLWRVPAAVELLITTGDPIYRDFLRGQREGIVSTIKGEGVSGQAPRIAWLVARALPHLQDEAFTAAITDVARGYRARVEAVERKSPYRVPYEPDIWGAGWQIQGFGIEEYYLHRAFPEIFPRTTMLHALSFILGCHPGPNTASFVSGVGAKSLTTAYGFNRADWSHIPGGSASGTALIRPDFPELLEWPFLWQQTEYVLGGGTTDYLFLVLAADRLLNEP